MKKYFTPLCLMAILLSVTSCDRTYDCVCTARNNKSTYVEEIRAVNKDDGREKCLELMDRTNTLSYPGVDCDLD